MVSSKEILSKIGRAHGHTLTDWCKAGIIPEPSIPGGRGKMRYWPDEVLPLCVKLVDLVNQGYSLRSAHMELMGIKLPVKVNLDVPLSDGELGWLAGLWDGEGSVGSQRSSATNVGPVIQMSMTCKKTIDHIVSMLTSIGITAIGYSYCERKPYHKDAHYLRVNRVQDIVLLAELLLPYTVTKKEQWRLVLEQACIKLSRRRVMPDGRLSKGGFQAPITKREFEIHEELRILNHRARPQDLDQCVSGSAAG